MAKVIDKLDDLWDKVMALELACIDQKTPEEVNLLVRKVLDSAWAVNFAYANKPIGV